MYITVRTIFSNHGDIDTAVKVYYDYEVAKTNLIIQRDILILELLIKYAGEFIALSDFDISKYGSLTFTDDVLEFVEDSGDYFIKYEIIRPENQKENEYKILQDLNKYGLNLL